MSNFGQAALTIVGTVVGAYFGYPQLGFVLGSLAGQALFPTQLPGVTGPRLDDLRTTTSVVGSPVVIAYGTMAVPGTVIWVDDVVEHSTTEEVGGKGGPEQDVTTFTYTQSIAIGLCEGEIADVTRIWENGKLVYDVRAQQDGESNETYQDRIDASVVYGTTFTLYTGSEDQEPDPTIELQKGAGNVPAFRGLAYIVYPDRQLRDDQGRRHPNFKFEISNCSDDFAAQVVFTESGTWLKPHGLSHIEVLAIGAGGGGGAGAISGGASAGGGGGGGGGGGASSATINVEDLPDEVTVTVGIGGQGAPQYQGDFADEGENGDDGGDTQFGAFITAEGGTSGKKGFNFTGGQNGFGGRGNLAWGGDGGSGTSSDGGDGTSTTNAPVGNPLAGYTPGKPAGPGGGGGGSAPPESDGGAGGSGEADPDNPLGATGGLGGTSGHMDGGNGETSTLMHGGGGGGGGHHNSGFFGGIVAGGGQGGAGARYGAGGGGGGCGNWGGGPLVLGQGGGDGASGIVIVNQFFEDDVACTTNLLSGIISDICHRAGLTDDEFDVSDLEEIVIDGYAITRPMPARAAIDPLRSVGFFDIVESDGVLKFVRRGKAAVATFDASDLAAHDYNTDPPPAVTVKKVQDVELPRLVRVHYFAASRDYEAGEQVSPSRISTEAVNDVDVELAVAISDDFAAQIAEVLWADAWQSRWGYESAIDAMHWIHLDPADVVILPVDGSLIRARIISYTIQGGEIMPLAMCRDDDGAYVSEAVAQVPERQPNTIVFYPPTEMILLDLPALRDEDDNAGFYAACAPEGAGTWLGAAIARSLNGGVSYENTVASVATSAALGTIVTLAPSGITTTWDDANEIIVDIRNGTLESRTDAEVLLGANAAAIGVHGRWEIVQFGLAELVSEGRYRLTHLLRGRRGTERFISTMQAGDTFVLISGTGIVRIPMDQALIGTELTYRATTVNTPPSTGSVQDFAGAGEALRPFSPVYVTAEFDDDGNIDIEWVRRGRLSQELRSGADIPLSEASESYEIDILEGSTVVRTLTSTVQSTSYTVAQQNTDFTGSPLPPILTIRVYQMSAVLGRGTPGETTI